MSGLVESESESGSGSVSEPTLATPPGDAPLGRAGSGEEARETEEGSAEEEEGGLTEDEGSGLAEDEEGLADVELTFFSVDDVWGVEDVVGSSFGVEVV